jgi:hypothetical protein
MADRVHFFFRQRVTEQELNLAFELLERADRNLAADLGIFGIVSGAVPTPHEPVADLSVDLNGPARAYDRVGQRVFFGSGQTVGVARDSVGVSTEVLTPGHERWVSVFLRFDRVLTDERTDGNSQRVSFRQDESFELVVRQGAESAVGSALRVPLEDDELLVCDVRREFGVDRVRADHLDVSRRQAFVFARSGSVGVFAELWQVLRPAAPQLQAALDAVDQLLSRHFDATERRHRSRDIDHAPSGFVTAQTVQGALDEVATKLSSAVDGAAGASLVGADAVPGTPRALAAGSVDGQLSALLSFLNAHVGAASSAHNAAAIRALPHHWITTESVQAQLQELVQGLRADRISAAAYRNLAGTTVQAQLQELVDDLRSTGANEGTSLIGGAALAGNPRAVGTGTLLSQLQGILNQLNAHAGSSDHDARYGRRVYVGAEEVQPNATHTFTTLTPMPDSLVWSYDTFDADGSNGRRWFNGTYTANIRVWFDKLSNGASARIRVQNRNSVALRINVAAYQVG